MFIPFVFWSEPSIGVQTTTVNLISTDVPKTISSSGTPTVFSYIPTTGNLPYSGTIQLINLVTTTGTHTRMSDITATLEYYVGGLTYSAILWQSLGGSLDNWNIKLADSGLAYSSIPTLPNIGGGGVNTYQPLQPLSVFIGLSAGGRFALRVRDGQNTQGGSLSTFIVNLTIEG
jgi:hypothetical protein